MEEQRLHPCGGFTFGRKVALLAFLLGMLFLVGGSGSAKAALWSSVPNPFPCSASSNACVSHTGFNPNASYWGQYTHPLGNCTNYVAYRVGALNGGPKPRLTGNAINWRGDVQRSFGSGAANGNPAVGSVAWWGTSKGADGHVAYVEQVSGNSIYISESIWGVGSRRKVLTRGQAGWPESFLHIKDAPAGSTSINNNDFIKVDGKPEVFRVAGGAPVYVSSWNAFGGSQPTKTVSQGQFDGLRPYPADGTFISGGGHVYRIAGGAPVYVSTWNVYGGGQPTTSVDPAAIDNAGGTGVWRFLRSYPVDGTFIAGGGHVYRVAGGAPVYVSTWNAFGGAKPVVELDGAAIDNAGGVGPWRFLQPRPVDGTFISGGGHVYRMAGGAPIYVSNWNVFGGGQPTVAVDGAAIDNAGGSGRWRFLSSSPADGTLIKGHSTKTIYKFAGGAPTAVSSMDVLGTIGGGANVVTVDEAAITNAGREAPWRFIRALPIDGTFIKPHNSFQIYRMAGGAPIGVSNPAMLAKLRGDAPIVNIDAKAIAQSGGSGPWRFLRNYPLDGTFLQSGPKGPLYVVVSGIPHRFNVIPDKAVVIVDPVAISRAGRRGAWRFLRARPGVEVARSSNRRSGATSLAITCPSTGLACEVRIKAKARVQLGRGKSLKIGMSSRSLSLKSGEKKKVRLNLPKKLKKARKKAEKVMLTITVRTKGVGKAWTTKIRLKGPRRR